MVTRVTIVAAIKKRLTSKAGQPGLRESFNKIQSLYEMQNSKESIRLAWQKSKGQALGLMTGRRRRPERPSQLHPCMGGEVSD